MRMVSKVDPRVTDIFTHYRKTHNDGVFDVYTDEIRSFRSNSFLTGLPDNYARGRIIGDYRRLALYGLIVSSLGRRKTSLASTVL